MFLHCFYHYRLSADNRAGTKTSGAVTKELTKGLTKGFAKDSQKGLAKGLTKDSQKDSQKDSRRTRKRTHNDCPPKMLFFPKQLLCKGPRHCLRTGIVTSAADFQARGPVVPWSRGPVIVISRRLRREARGASINLHRRKNPIRIIYFVIVGNLIVSLGLFGLFGPESILLIWSSWSSWSI